MTARYATTGDLDAIVPATVAIDNAIRQHYLDAAAELIGLDAYGDKALFAHVQLTAHFLAQLGIATLPGGGAAVTSLSAGAISASFATATVMSATDGDFSETAFGRRFLAIRRSIFASAVVA